MSRPDWYRARLRQVRLWKRHPIYEFHKPGYPYKPDSEYVRPSGKFTTPGMVYIQFKTAWGWTVYAHHQGKTIDQIVEGKS